MEEGEEIRDTHVVNGAAIEVGGETRPGQSGISPVRGTVDGDAFGIGNAGIDEPMHSVCDVVLHGESPLFIALFEKLTAVACAAAEVELEHGVTARTEELHFGREAPIVARPRASMWIDDDGKR